MGIATGRDLRSGSCREVRLTCVKALVNREAMSKGVSAEDHTARMTELVAKGLLRAGLDLSVTNSLDTYGTRFQMLESPEMRVCRERRAVISALLFAYFNKPGKDPERTAVLDDLKWCAYAVGVPQLAFVKGRRFLRKPAALVYDRSRRLLTIGYHRVEELPGLIEDASDDIRDGLRLTGPTLERIRRDADAIGFHRALFLHRLLSAGLTVCQVSATTGEWITPMGLWALERHPRLYLRLPHAVLTTLQEATKVPSPERLQELELLFPGTEAERWGFRPEQDGVVKWIISLHEFLTASRGCTCLNPRFLSDQDLMTLVPCLHELSRHRLPDPRGEPWLDLIRQLLSREAVWSARPA